MRVRRGHRRAGDRDGEPRAGGRRARPGGLPRGLRRDPAPARAPGDPALARRHVRSRARRLLGLGRPRRGDRHAAGDHRRARRQGRRRQGLAARRRARGRAAAAPAGGRAPLHRRRLQLPGADRGDEPARDALLGVFDAIAPAAAAALHALDAGDREAYDRILAPTVPLARKLFEAPTFNYKTGIVFLAFLNGHQEHFRMVGGMESARSFATCRAVRARRPRRPAARPGARERACGTCSHSRGSRDRPRPAQPQPDHGRPLEPGRGGRALRGGGDRLRGAVAAPARDGAERAARASATRACASRSCAAAASSPRRAPTTTTAARSRRRPRSARRCSCWSAARRSAATCRPRAPRSRPGSSGCCRSPPTTASGSGSSRCTR